MISPNIEKSIQKKVSSHRSELITLLKNALEVKGSNDANDVLQNIVDIYTSALGVSLDQYFNAEPAGALIVNSYWTRPNQLDSVVSVLSTFPLKILTHDEMLQLQPRLFKVVTDISNGYWRQVSNTIVPAEFKLPSQKTLEQKALSREMLPEIQKPFIPYLIQEFWETNQRLEDEIDEHKRARVALVESERRYRTLAESANDYIFVINKNDQVEYLNQYAKKLFQPMKTEITGENRTSFFNSETNEVQGKILQKVFETGRAQHRQNWAILKDGTRLFLDTHLVPLSDNGNVRAVLGISRDLTREKQNDDKIAESEKKYHSLFDAIHNAIFLIDAGKIVDCNTASTQFFEKSKDELLDHDFIALFKDGHADKNVRKKICENFDLCKSQQVRHFELEYTRTDEVLYFEIHFSCFSGPDSSLVLAVIRNITPYKKANETIRASEERFRDIIKRSIDGYFFVDKNYRLKHYNSSAEKILTYTREELNERLFSKLHAHWNKKLHRVMKKAMGGTTFEWEEFHFLDRYDVDRWVAINVRRVYEHGHVTGIEGFIKDITHRKKAEIELIENEARYRALFESTPYDVFGLTTDRQFLKVNQNFQKNWGHVENKMLDTFRPKSLALLISGLCDNVEDGKKAHETTFSRSSKKRLHHYRVILAPIITEKEDIIGFAGLIIDTTDAVTMLAEKKNFAERLIQSSEEEQRRISRDIHDSLGQILFALQLEISSAKTLLKKDANMAERILQSSEDKLSTAMNEASSICYRLSPQLLADFGFVEALQDLVHNIQMSGNIKVDFEKKWREGKKSKSLETALFRVSQEALANIMKHANASHVRIKLMESEDHIKLSIADDGDGFDFQAASRKRKRGFGLINMKERIEMLGGELLLKTAPQSGTQIDISIPLRIKEAHE